MKIKTTWYMLKESFKNLWRNRLMSLASMSSVAATLLILGLVFILIVNISSLSEGMEDQFESIQIYLEDGLTKAEVESIGNDMYTIDGVDQIVFESKTEAMENMKTQLGDYGYLLDGLESNPLPMSFVVYLKDISKSEEVYEKLKEYEGVEDIKYYKDTIDKIIKISNYVKNTGFGVILVLIFISVFIIGNTIKIAIASRKREIGIMKYVGATNWFIRWPFLIEGTLLGFLGAAISIVIVYFTYKYTYDIVTRDFYAIVAVYVKPLDVIMDDIVYLFLVLGSGIGAFGSIISLRKYLRV
ncbi:MAG: permease-like cell division protein FtsX [Firmicutes bacterium]|nr:permease-like cell division protein FtsX [Bacillota bacterium]